MALDINSPFQVWQAVILGAIQGLTEFLPVSSTAHLALVPQLFKWPDPGLAFDVALHIGTLLAVLFFFFGDLWRMFTSFLPAPGAVEAEQARSRNQATALVIGCLPAILAGVLLEKQVATNLRAPGIMATTLIGVALLMAWVEWREQGLRNWQSIRLREAVLIGVAQACALVPGVSRSGATITAGMFLGLERDSAARFSFLLGFPVIAGSAVYEGRHLPQLLAVPDGLRLLAVGILISFLSGYLAIAWLLSFLQTRTLWVFICYRIALGILILLCLPVLPAGH